MNRPEPSRISGGTPHRARIWRGDLVRLLLRESLGLQQSPVELEATARLLGFEPAAETRQAEADLDSDQQAPAKPRRAAGGGAALPPPTATGPVELAPIRFWRPVARELPEEEELDPAGPPPETLETLDSAPDTPPRPWLPPVAMPRLWRKLDDVLRSPRPRRALDTRRLVDRLARGAQLGRLPRLEGLAHSRVALIVDRSARLEPFFGDQRLLVRYLAARLGARSLRLLPTPGRDSAPAALGLAADEQVLALSDLGFYGHAEQASDWLRWGRALRRHGVAIHAVVPCAAERWQPRVGRLWSAIAWGSPERLPPVPAGPRREILRERLLALASPAVRLEPGLLRALRQLVPGADLGTEVDVWHASEVASRSSLALMLDAGAARRLRARFAALAPERKAAAAATILAWHRHLPPEIRAEEVAHLLASGVEAERLGDDAEAATRLLEQVAATLERGGPADWDSQLVGWLRRLESRLSARAWNHRLLRKPLIGTYRALRSRVPTQPAPAGMTPEMMQSAEDLHTVSGKHVVYLEPGGLRLRGMGGVGEARAESQLVQLEARKPRVAVTGGPSPARFIKPEGEAVLLEQPAEETRLATDVEAVVLEAWQPVLEDPTSWACAAGRDQHGLWAAFEVDGVRQRLRWIPPGRFWMGSPKQEAGRYSDEGPRHPVTLSEGFWLAETPCTQALWRAVMGENPSRFKGDRRPVEQVSWEDCQRFLDRLNERFRHLDARLPTEAEWEYACRAGTDTATWLGGTETGESPQLAEIAWYDANSDGTTHEVAGKKANPWGLHDLLGNVDEWCWDWNSSYTASPEHDPEGPAQGSLRVLRGGSWLGHARYVRAAYRYWYVPDARYSGRGFRLSRGRAPVLRGAEKEPGGAGSGAARRGTSRRAGARRSRAWVERLRWASDGGTDVFGRWASFEIGEVATRLRWIVPGRFWMGSPAEETGRDDDEGPRHEVTLTEGFWLADTPCTQALWQAVMGSNPSEFHSPRRPVENVSWNEAQRFLERLNEHVPGLEARLPSEAQWEHACRAGTDTATWLGDLEILGESNAPGLDEIAWYGGNSGVDFDLPEGRDSSDWPEKQYPHVRAGTREVARKAPNPWGLYDMLGNVWEWCADWWADAYPEGPRIDPIGPEQGSHRVIRGGSWVVRARGVRAACRGWDDPDGRPSYQGFRLSRGPER